MKKIKSIKVRQSNHLIESPYSQEFSIHEIKLFEIALAECKQEDIKLYDSETNKKFSFSSTELAKLLNTSVSTISHEIEKTAARIMKKSIHLRKILPDGSIEFEMINIMPYAKYKNGVLDFQINYQIIPYLVELNSNFTEFHLDNLLIMNSSYGIKLYKLLYQYKNIKHRIFFIDDLKKQFGLIDKYQQYKDFKRRVLEPSILQINTNTDLDVEYSEIKLGRRVEKLEFKFNIKKDTLIKIEPLKVSNMQEINESFAVIDSLLGENSIDISEKNKLKLNNLMLKKGVTFVECSINYAKKNAKTNFEKYLLDTIGNNWAEVDIQKLESKREAEEIDKQKKQAEVNAENKQLELDNANKSEIEHLFIKLAEVEQSEYFTLATNILNKNAAKLKHVTVELLSYSIFAVTNGRYYDKKIEIYISKFLNHSLSIHDYIK